MWSPALARLRTVAVIAAMPEANATAQLPPSRDAIRSSRAVMVGLLRRVYIGPSSARLNRFAAFSQESKT